MKFLNVIVGILVFVITIIYYKATKDYSIRYKPKTTKVANTLLIVNIINSIFIGYLSSNINAFFFGFGLFIGLVINYLVLKGQLRAAQSLSDKNWLRGSSFLKNKFKWKNIDWKLILKLNIILFIWTLVVFKLGNPEIKPSLLKKSTQDPIWIFIISNVLSFYFLAPIREEVIFRFLGVNLFLHWIGKSKINKKIAVIIPTLIWTLLHTGVLTNNLLKYIQVLPLGIACGYLLYKKDIEHSILLHITFNVLATLNALILFK
ncbi:MAG: CPBP family intramembrane metalloprotease [Firmicutes bacterium]|nr:CPBP family intramembrane metalloprotease [Bacillota bacterium]